MHLLACFRVILIYASVTNVFGDRHKLTAVSNSHIASILYRRIRARDGPDAEMPPPMHPDTKSRICHHITGSNLYKYIMREKRVYIHKIAQQLRIRVPRIFERLFEPSTDPTSVSDAIYTNRTQPVDVYPNIESEEMVREYVFACLTIGRDFRIHDYYVSREYNLSFNSNLYIPGRFILDNAGDVDVFAVAEEPAKSVSAKAADAERVYLERRVGREPAENEDLDPICLLNDCERLRVCTLILSSAYFEGELTFVPDYDYIDEEECISREISFQDDQVRSQTVGKFYKEWMFGCRPDKRYATFQAEYFISRAYDSESDSNEVFVYRNGHDRKVIIENLFSNVRFEIHDVSL